MTNDTSDNLVKLFEQAGNNYNKHPLTIINNQPTSTEFEINYPNGRTLADTWTYIPFSPEELLQLFKAHPELIGNQDYGSNALAIRAEQSMALYPLSAYTNALSQVKITGPLDEGGNLNTNLTNNTYYLYTSDMVNQLIPFFSLIRYNSYNLNSSNINDLEKLSILLNQPLNINILNAKENNDGNTTLTFKYNNNLPQTITYNNDNFYQGAALASILLTIIGKDINNTSQLNETVLVALSAIQLQDEATLKSNIEQVTNNYKQLQQGNWFTPYSQGQSGNSAIPLYEYNSNGQRDYTKIAGFVNIIHYLSEQNNMDNFKIKLSYVPLDKNYNGKLDNIYFYSAGGSSGFSMGIGEYPIYQQTTNSFTVNYIDDTTGKTLQTVTKIGLSNSLSNYSTLDTIQSYIKQNYQLINDETSGIKNISFGKAFTQPLTYNVHLKHNTKNTSESIVKKLTVHYVYQNGNKAFEDKSGSPLTFTRTGIHDLVTNQITWNAWTPTQVFENISSPALDGYIPNIQTITNVSVNNNSPEVTEKTVIYTPNNQLLTVKYIDDITGQILKTVNKQGLSDSSAEYNTKNDIANYEKQNYILVKDDTKGINLIFDHDNNINQYYEVHLTHKYATINENKSINETIHYIYNNGKEALNDYHATPIKFTRTGNKDLVTNSIAWNNWQPSTASFDSVISPVIEGFTPNIDKINSIVVTPDDEDIDQTIVYSPDEQTIVINYIDQTNGKILTTDTLTGKSNDVSQYSTQNKVNNYLQQNYTFIKDETNGKPLQFDHDSKITQIYNVYLGHKTKSIQQQHSIKENINYKYENGAKAHESYVANPLTFTQTGTLDLVNGTITYNNNWTPAQSFTKVTSPIINGYTPNQATIDEIKVDHNSSDIIINVIYKANNQTAHIKYIDDTTGKTINVDNAIGKFNAPIEFTNNVQAQIKTYGTQGYKLVSNSFNNQKYQANNAQNQFEVHLAHNTINIQRDNTITRTIKYQYSNGKEAANNKVQTVNFAQNGIKDEVTNNINWLPVNTQNIPSVTTPTIKGYTPDIILVPEQNVSFNSKDQIIVVTYKANEQLAKISYIDDTTGKVLQTNEAKGSFDQLINFSTEPLVQIKNYINQGYQLVSNNFNNQKYQANNNQNQFEVHLVHETVNVKKENKVTRTINYVDSKATIPLHQPTIQTVIFITTGVKDLVTNKIVWNNPDIQSFNSINSPLIEGYNIPDIEMIEKQSVNMNDSDQEITVHYDKIIPEQTSTNESSSSSKHNNTPNTPSSSISVNESSTPISDQKVNSTKISGPNNSIKTNTPTSFITQSNDTPSTHLNKNEKAPELPQTGNNSQNEMKVLGLAGLTLTGSLLIMKKKQKKN